MLKIFTEFVYVVLFEEHFDSQRGKKNFNVQKKKTKPNNPETSNFELRLSWYSNFSCGNYANDCIIQ